jgi:putative oxidoreductase
MILTGLTRYRDFGLLILRLGIGTMFLTHGVPKLMGGPDMWKGVGAAMGNLGVGAFPAVWGFLAGLSEAGGGACLILGWAFRPACILMAFTMAVAVTHHFTAGEGLAGASHAMEMGIVFVSLILIGPGRYSVDKK